VVPIKQAHTSHSVKDYKNLSLWFSQLSSLNIRPALSRHHEVDVAILGAGFTGLWTAYYLKKKSPELKIAVFEADTVGFGASGRNGGWLMGELAGQDSYLQTLPDDRRAQARHLVHAIPEEAKRVIEAEGIDCDFQYGGVLYVAARYAEQKDFLAELYRHFQQEGYTDQDYTWLDASHAHQRLAAHNTQAALFSPHCARIQPAKLVRGLADVCESLGVEIFEQSPVTAWAKNAVEVGQHRVSCRWVVPALEAYGVSVHKAPFSWSRYQRPVQSAIVATEPLSEQTWQSIGLHQSEVFSDVSRIVTYGQRTADNRLVFGARGSYLFGAALQHNTELNPQGIALRRKLIEQLFPQLEGVNITHAWGGNLAIGRKFRPHMVINKDQGYALSAAYGGEGVGATNLAGRTLSDAILGIESTETSMPWVDWSGTFQHSRKWEPEPIPWLGYRLFSAISMYEDQLLCQGKGQSVRRKIADKLYRLLESQMG